MSPVVHDEVERFTDKNKMMPYVKRSKKIPSSTLHDFKIEFTDKTANPGMVFYDMRDGFGRIPWRVITFK